MCVVAYVVRFGYIVPRCICAYVMSWWICRTFVCMSCVFANVVHLYICLCVCRAFVHMSCVRTYIVCMWGVRVKVCILCSRAYVFMLFVRVYVYSHDRNY